MVHHPLLFSTQFKVPGSGWSDVGVFAIPEAIPPWPHRYGAWKALPTRALLCSTSECSLQVLIWQALSVTNSPPPKR